VDLLDRLSVWTGRLDLLTEGPYDVPPRQQTLRSTIDWSFALLDPDDRELGIRFAVFAGGATVEAASAGCTPDGDVARPAARLAAMGDKSVVGGDGDGSRMREPVRTYADERLSSSPAGADTRQRHAEYFAEFAGEVRSALTDAATGEVHARVAREYPNFRAAL